MLYSQIDSFWKRENFSIKLYIFQSKSRQEKNDNVAFEKNSKDEKLNLG